MVLRDRTRLEKSIEQVLGIEQELDDAATLIELGEAEDDAEVVAEAEATIAGLQRRSEKLVVLSIAPIIASAFRAVFEDESVSEIFAGENV